MKKIIFPVILVIIAFILAGFFTINNRGSVPSGGDILPVEEGELELADSGGIYFKDIEIGAIFFDNDSAKYSVKRGEFFKNGEKLSPEKDPETIERLKHLVLFYQWNKEEPLLFSPFVNTAALRKSISFMAENQALFFEKVGKGEPIYPLKFLNAFADASDAYMEFSGRISEKNAEKIIAKQEIAQKTYGESLASARKAFSIFSSPQVKDKKIAYLGGESVTDYSVIKSDLSLMTLNADMLKKELDERKKCFELSKSCRRPIFSLSRPEVGATRKNSPPAFLLKSELNIYSGAKNFAGPYEVEASCWSGSDKAYLYVSSECRKNINQCFEHSYLADRIFFWKLSERFPPEKELFEKGIKVIPQGGTVSYGCNNLEYKPALEQLNIFYLENKNRRIFAEIKKGQEFDLLTGGFKDIINAGAEIENSFFSADIPSQEALENLGQWYGYVYAEMARAGAGNTPERGELLRRHLVIKDKTANFDLVLNRGSFHFKNYSEKIGKLTNPELNPPLLSFAYATRTNYALTFLNFSPFVWRISEHPRYALKNFDKNNLPENASFVLDYATAVKEYGLENLNRWRDEINKLRLQGNQYLEQF